MAAGAGANFGIDELVGDGPLQAKARLADFRRNARRRIHGRSHGKSNILRLAPVALLPCSISRA